MANTVLDIIQGALLNLNSYTPGEPLDPYVTNVGLQLLNDLFDSYSTDRDFVWSQNETLFTWQPLKYQYSVGNYTSPTTFTGSVTQGTNAIFGAQFPTGVAVGTVISDTSGVLPAGTTITQLGFPFSVTAFPLNAAVSATLSINWTYPSTVSNVIFPNGDIRAVTLTNGAATATWSVPLTSACFSTILNVIGMALISASPISTQATLQFSWQIVGDIPMPRPLRFRNGYTRATTSGNSNLDFFFELKSYEEYKRELLKNIPGPWPYIAAYRPDFPLGQLFVYPAPGAAYTAHLFTDVILADAANPTAEFSMPQGYTRAFKKLLALEFAPILMKPVGRELRAQAQEAKNLIKALNAMPPVPLTYDTAISRAQTHDAGWIIHGGFV
jgi:hypothetical protein